jgi:ornithine cyclodeaminase
MVRILTDRDLMTGLDMRTAVDAVESFLLERAAGTAVSLPRTGMKVGEGGLVFTPGASPGLGAMGLRVYTAGLPADEQVVAVWDWHNGHLESIFVGNMLGAVRTGAIGGVAMRWFSKPEARVVGVVGAGLQAYTQLRAAMAVRSVAEVRIYRRTQDGLAEQADQWSRELGMPVRAAAGAREAVAEADIVILATRASEPVIEANWLAPGAHVNSLGRKYRGDTEIGMDLVERAGLLVSDFPDQYRREEPFILQGTPHLERMQDLAACVAAGKPRDPADTSLFLSHGLAGTEVVVARALGRRAAELGLGVELSL